MYANGTDYETVGRRLKIHGRQALHDLVLKELLKSKLRQSLIINPRKLDKDKSDTVLNIDDTDIIKTEKIEFTSTINLSSPSISASYALRPARKSEYFLAFAI